MGATGQGVQTPVPFWGGKVVVISRSGTGFEGALVGQSFGVVVAVVVVVVAFFRGERRDGPRGLVLRNGLT